MSDNKFTPGPWALGKGFGLHGVEVVGGPSASRVVCGVIGVDRPAYGIGGDSVGTVDTPDGWANAHLIVAAPDMFSYGGDLIASLDPNTLNPEQFNAWSGLRDAMLKARGQS